MAFISIASLAKYTRNDSPAPKLTVRANGSCHLTKIVVAEFNTVEVEIDTEEKLIRLKTGANYSRKLTGRVGVCFAIPSAVYRDVLNPGETKRELPLTLSDDGWWYGSYAASGKHQEGE